MSESNGDLETKGSRRSRAEKERRLAIRELRDEIREAHKNGLGATEIARRAGISRRAVYNALER